MNPGSVIQNNGPFHYVFDNIKSFFLLILSTLIWLPEFLVFSLGLFFIVPIYIFTLFYEWMKTTNIAKKIRKLLVLGIALGLFAWIYSPGFSI